LKKLEKEKLTVPKEYRGAVLRDIKLVKNQIKEHKTHSKELKSIFKNFFIIKNK